MHIVSNKSLQRPGHIYTNGVGVTIGTQPEINWKHIDGPLLYCSDGQLHWLTWRERARLFFGTADIHDIDFEYRSRGLGQTPS